MCINSIQAHCLPEVHKLNKWVIICSVCLSNVVLTELCLPVCFCWWYLSYILNNGFYSFSSHFSETQIVDTQMMCLCIIVCLMTLQQLKFCNITGNDTVEDGKDIKS
jgi:hypothetical protein